MKQQSLSGTRTGAWRTAWGKAVAAIAGAAMMPTIMPLGTQTAVAADNAFTDGGKVTAYAPTGVGNGTTTSPDQSSVKYMVTANGVKVDAIKYDANGNNFDIHVTVTPAAIHWKP